MKNKQLKQFFELHKEDIENHILYDATEEETINTIYDSDLNFKHADPTTRQRCLDQYEISLLLESSIEYLKTFDDRCSICGKIIKDEDYICEMESRGEFWGEPCSENVCVGYSCSYCGHEEEY